MTCVDDLPLLYQQRTGKEDTDMKPMKALKASFHSQGEANARVDSACLYLHVFNPAVA